MPWPATRGSTAKEKIEGLAPRRLYTEGFVVDNAVFKTLNTFFDSMLEFLRVFTAVRLLS